MLTASALDLVWLLIPLACFILGIAGLVLAIINITRHQEVVDIVMLVLTIVAPFVGSIAAIWWYLKRRQDDAAPSL